MRTEALQIANQGHQETLNFPFLYPVKVDDCPYLQGASWAPELSVLYVPCTKGWLL